MIKPIIIGLIKFYQYIISPHIAPSCRFTPSCSQYARESIEKHGVFKGSYLSILRILKCNPWNIGGNDPVP